MAGSSAGPVVGPITDGGRALILGCGYVGTAIAQHWRTAGITVTATTTREERVKDLEVIADRVIVLDATEPEKLREALEGQDTVLMCIGAKGPSDYRHAYLECAEALISAVPEFPSIQQVIYTGTYSLYGDHGGAWVTEDTPPKLTTPKSQILAETEQTILSLNTLGQNDTPQGAIACVLRLGGICGPGREVTRILSRAAGKTRPGDGSSWAHWTHLDDIVGAIAWARQKRLSGIFNVVQDIPIQQKDLFEQALGKANLPPVIWDPQLPAAKSYNVRVSNQRLREAGYTMQYPTVPI